MKKTLKFTLPLSILILIIGIVVIRLNYADDDIRILAKVIKGDFNVEVMVTGELEAKNSVKIYGPEGLRRYKIYEITIQSMLEEGELVKKGQEIAKLDPSTINSRLQDAILEYEEADARYQQTVLDTTLNMREARDKLVGLKFVLKDKKLDLQQSKYEPPATTQKNKMSVDKAKATYEMSIRNLEIRKNKYNAQMRQVEARRKRKFTMMDGLKSIASQCSIFAPSDGMLIYYKKNRNVITEGSKVSTWDPVIATLPDLSKMISVAYVNEIDIRKIKKGQIVELELDAFPEKRFTGKVIKVANVAEQRPNSESKFFSIKIEINEKGNLLRPAMTTSNRVIAKQFSDVIYIPIEGIHTLNDSSTFVYKQEGLDVVKQKVQVGDMNNTDAIILAGLEEGEKLFLSEFKSEEDKDMIILEF